MVMHSSSRFRRRLRCLLCISGWLLIAGVAHAQPPLPARTTDAQIAAEVVTPPDYTIGPEDVLTIVFWKEKEMSGDVIVRPDGKITLPLLNDIVATGLTPDQLRARVSELAGKFFQDAKATVTVKAINSRRVFITGMVEKPGSYVLTTRTTVLQLIAMAGGLKEFAKSSKIVLMRNEGGRDARYIFDYKEVVEGKDLSQNVEMKPGDTVVVP